MIIAKFLICIDLDFTINELPTGQATHGGHKSQSGAKSFNQLPFLFILELPFPVAKIGNFRIEDQQIHQLCVAVVGIILQGFAAAVNFKLNQVVN